MSIGPTDETQRLLFGQMKGSIPQGEGLNVFAKRYYMLDPLKWCAIDVAMLAVSFIHAGTAKLVPLPTSPCASPGVAASVRTPCYALRMCASPGMG